MKQIIYALVLLFSLWACQKDKETAFVADLSDVKITFEAYNGGALMNYSLPPGNSDIYAIQAKYKNHMGKELLVRGTYLDKQINLFGFVNREEKVPVEIRLVNFADQLSEPQTKYFSTEICGASLFFDGLEVAGYWNGFTLKYTVDDNENIDGFFHVGKLGINPKTQKLDTLLLKSDVIKQGVNVHGFLNEADPETHKTTVVVWTEDYLGNRVKKKVFPDVQALLTEKVKTVSLIRGSSIEDPDYKTGWKYLFDGDTKGESSVNRNVNESWHGFLPEEYTVPGSWIFDLNEPKVPAFLKMYVRINTNVHWPFIAYYVITSPPKHVKVYGSNDPDAEQWDLLGEFHDREPIERSWARQVFIEVSGEEFEAMDSIFTTIDLNDGTITQSYRYLRVEILETNYDVLEDDQKGRVNLEELEIIVKSN